MAHKNCKLGAVQSQDEGYGFIVHGEKNKLLFSLTYETRGDAEAARDTLAKVIEEASVVGFG
jgi:Tfp pilus assembly protein FimV